jgi:hypothetical protein
MRMTRSISVEGRRKNTKCMGGRGNDGRYGDNLEIIVINEI